jgi:phenylacetic acid degradation operon negative regulatory protein
VESDQRGFYRLSRAALPVNRQVRSWAAIEDEVAAWDGGWLAVETSALPRRDRQGARVRERALRFLGFESLTKALRVRPDNRLGGVGACRERLVGLGFEPAPIVFRLEELDTHLEREARNLWSRYELERVYRELKDRLAESAERLPSLSTRDAMCESFQLGGEAVRQLALDPLLPQEIIDVNARRALIEEMRRYDELGRGCWKQWAGDSIEPERSPVDIGSLGSSIEAAPLPEPA